MAFTIGKYGLVSLIPLAKLMGSFLSDLSDVCLVGVGRNCLLGRFQYT